MKVSHWQSRMRRLMLTPGFNGSARQSLRLSLCVVLTGLLVCLTAIAMAQAPNKKSVLIFSLLRKDSPAINNYERIYQKSLNESLNGNLDYYTEYVDLARFPEPDYQLALRDFLRQNYRGRHLDLVVADSDVAVKFLAQYGAEVFPGVPVVFSMDRTTFSELQPPSSFTGIVFEPSLRDTLDLALKLQPDTQRVFVVSGASQTVDKWHEMRARKHFAEFAERVEINYLSGLSMSELKRRLAQLPEHSIIYYLILVEDSAGNRFLAPEALDQISAIANAPIYSWHQRYLNHGIIGGSLQNPELMPRRMAELSQRILLGERPGDIPVTEIEIGEKQFDARQLRRWGISEDRLQPGSIVLFKEPTFWERYKWHIIVGFGVFTLQLLLIGFLLLERHKFRRVSSVLALSEERNRTILRAIPDLMFVQANDGTYLDYYARDASLLFLPPDQFLGKKMEELFLPGLCDEFNASFQRALEAKETQCLEYSLEIAGERRWFEARIASSEEDKLLTIVRDVTESRRAEEALRESELRFATAFNSNPSPMTLTTLDLGRFIDVNQSFLNISGYERNEVVGRTSPELNVWETPNARTDFLKQLRENGSVQNVELKFRAKGGEMRSLLVAAEVVELANQPCVLMTSTDITEQKQNEQMLSELTARLLHTQDQERRHIAAELHDVTAQSIGLMLLNLAYLRKSSPEIDSRSKDKLAESIALGEQALREIRTLSYVLHPPLLDQAGLVTALQWYAKGFTERSGIRVGFSSAGNDEQRMPPDVEYSLFRVVQECLTNIRRHTNSETASITLSCHNDEVVLVVQDRGTTSIELSTNGNSIEGLGVGIPGMRHRLKQLGGELTVDSTPNGTTVTATVPVKWVIYDSHSISR